MWTRSSTAPGEEPPVARDDFTGSLRLAGDETLHQALDQALAWFDDAKARYLSAVAALDPDGVFFADPRPDLGHGTELSPFPP